MKYYLPLDVVKAKRWEGKPLSFKIKFLYANYPAHFFSLVIGVVVLPAIGYYFVSTYDGSRNDVMRKYKSSYIVVRDDHPNIENIIKEKEAGREHFPKF